MGESSDRLVPIVSLLVISLAVGSAVSTVGHFNAESPNSLRGAVTTAQNSANSEQSPATAPTSSTAGGSFLLVAGSDCRRVLYDGLSVYADPNPNSTVLVRTLYAGQQVGLTTTSTSIGPDGRTYIQVSVPYGATAATIGYMPAQTVPNANGVSFSTLGLCETSPSPSPSPSPTVRPPVNGRW